MDLVRRYPVQSLLDPCVEAEAFSFNEEVKELEVKSRQPSPLDPTVVYVRPASSPNPIEKPPSCRFFHLLPLIYAKPVQGLYERDWFSAYPDYWRQMIRLFWGAADHLLRGTGKDAFERFIASRFTEGGRVRRSLIPATLSIPRLPSLHFAAPFRSTVQIYGLDEDEAVFETYLRSVAHKSTWMEMLAMSLFGMHLEALRTANVIALLNRAALKELKRPGLARLQYVNTVALWLESLSWSMVCEWEREEDRPPADVCDAKYDSMAQHVMAYLDAVEHLKAEHHDNCVMMNLDLFHPCTGGDAGCPLSTVKVLPNMAPALDLFPAAQTANENILSPKLDLPGVSKDELVVWLQPARAIRIDDRSRQAYLHNRLIHLMQRKWSEKNAAVDMFLKQNEMGMLAHFRLALPGVWYPPTPDAFLKDQSRSLGFWNYMAAQIWLLTTFWSLYGVNDFDLAAMHLLDMMDGYTYTAYITNFLRQWRDVLRHHGLDVWMYSGFVRGRSPVAPESVFASPALVASVHSICGVSMRRFPRRLTPQAYQNLRMQVMSEYETL